MRALTDAEQEEKGRSLPPRTQAIFGFDMDAWAEWKRRVRPGDTLMRHRAPVQLPRNARLVPTADPDAPPGGFSCSSGALRIAETRPWVGFWAVIGEGSG